jgi:hypothetical protein
VNKLTILITLLLLLSFSVHAKEGSTQDTETRYFGPIKYQTSKSGAYKLIPDISLIGTMAAAYFVHDPVGETGHDPSRTGFTLQEIELGLQSTIDPYFRADVFLAFSDHGVELCEGYVTTLFLPRGLQLKAGKMKLPFGRQNPKHLETWDFADNTLPNKNLIGPHGLSEFGVEASYVFPLPFFLELQAAFANGDNDRSFGGTRKKDFLYLARLSTGFDLSSEVSLLFGGSGAWGFNESGKGNNTSLYGGDFLVKWKPKAYRSLVWQTEFIYRRMQFPGRLRSDGAIYSYVDYQFAKRWHAGLRYDLMGIPASVFPRESRVTPALSFNPTEYSRVRAQYEYDKVRGQDLNHAAILQLEFSMGPHGAHPY